MKKALSLILALLLCLTLSLSALAAGDAQRGVMRCEELIAPQYEYARPFSEGLAAVKKNGKWGFINEKNEVVVPFLYDVAFSFNEGKAVVGTDGSALDEDNYRWIMGSADCYSFTPGYIDKAGRYTPFVAPYSGSQVSMCITGEDIENDSVIFHNGFTQFRYTLFDVFIYGTDGVYRQSPKYIDSYTAVGPMNEGLVPANILDFWGWIDSSGDFVRMYSGMDDSGITKVYGFNQGLAPVWKRIIGADGEETRACGFLNRSFEWAVSPVYEDYKFTDRYRTFQVFGATGLAMVRKNGLYGAIDKSGRMVIPFAYRDLLPVSDGAIAFQDATGLYGYLNAADNSVMIPARYQLADSFHNGYAAVYDGSKAFLIDKKGNPISGADRLDAGAYFRAVGEDGAPSLTTPGEYVAFSRNGKYGIARISYLPPLPGQSEMDSWAFTEVATAISEDLVPAGLQNLYRNNITRAEFCDTVMQALTRMQGTTLDELVQRKTGRTIDSVRDGAPFIDSYERNVLAAYALGIVNGRGDGTFDPYASITRQEAAAFLMRTAKVLGMDVANAPSAGFSDARSFDSWGVDAINFVYRIGVMNGTGTDVLTFSPRGSYTREQSYMTIYRLFRAFKQATA